MFRTLALCLALMASLPAAAGDRSRSVAREFQRLHPCPATGKTTGACPGWVRDHRDPLCNGGPNSVRNMQWMTVEDGKRKDRWERHLCRRKR